MPLECLSQLCVKVLVEQRGRSCAQRSCEPDTWWHCLFPCSNLVVDPQFANPVVLSGSLAIQVFKRPMEGAGGVLAELEDEKLL